MKKLLLSILVLLSITVSANAVREVTLETKITGLYVAFFNRAADEGGLTYWTNRGNNAPNQSNVLKELAAGFATHPSFDRAYGSLGNQAFVEEIYKNALGREGDAPGVAYWTSRLNLSQTDPSYLSRSDFVSVFVEAALTFDRNDPQYAGLSEEDLNGAQLRHDLLANKAEAGLAFTHQLGTLSNVTDNDNPEEDPAYLASIKIISEVTEDVDTADMVIAFLSELYLVNDPIGSVMSYRGEAEDPCIKDSTYTAGDTYTFCVVGLPEEICTQWFGSNDDKEWVSFSVEGECVELGYPVDSKSKTDSGLTYYHTAGLYKDLTNTSDTIILSLLTEMGGTKLNDILSPDKQSTLILSELTESSVKVEVATSSGTRALAPGSVSLDKNSITFTAPKNIIDGNLTVKSGSSTLSSMTYTVVTAQTPYLVDISPYIIQAGDSVEINGSNLPSIPVKIVFEGQDSAFTQTATPSDNTVNFTVPQGVGSGDVYLKINQTETNRLYLSVKRSIDVKVVPGNDVDFNASKISFILGLEEYPLDENYNVTLNVENKDMQYLNAIVELPGDEAALLYSAVVLPDMTGTVTIDANSTAVSWIFMGMGVSVTTTKDKLRGLYEAVKVNTKVQEFADYINALQKDDFNAWITRSDEELKVKFQDALRNVVETPQLNRNTRSMMARDVNPNAVIITQDQVPENENIYVNDNIYSFEIKTDTKLSNGSVNIINDTRLYLSIEVKDKKNGKIVNGYAHYASPSNPLQHSIIGPKGWAFFGISSLKNIDLQGKDSSIEIVIGARQGRTDKNNLSKYLITRVWLEGVAAPALNIALSTIADMTISKGIFGKSTLAKRVASALSDIYGASFLVNLSEKIELGQVDQSILLKDFIIDPIQAGLKECYEHGVTTTKCEQTAKGILELAGYSGIENIGNRLMLNIAAATAKRMGEKSTATIPVIGWIVATSFVVYDNMGVVSDTLTIGESFSDMANNPKEINVDVDFPLEISSVSPICAVIPPSQARQEFIIEGEGFALDGDEAPEVSIGSGDDNTESTNVDAPYTEGTKMTATFNAPELMDEGSRSSHMFVKHMGTSIMYDKAIRMISTEDEKAYFDTIVPDRAMLGQTVTLNGCGWVPLENLKVYFTAEDGEVEGEVIFKTIDKIEVKVPQKAISGLIRVKTDNKESTQLFDVVPFGIFSVTEKEIVGGTEFAVIGKGLSSIAHLYFKDRDGNVIEGKIENVTDTGMWVKVPNGLAIGSVQLYVVLLDGMKSNKLLLKKIPKSPTASPSYGTIGNDGLTVTLSQEEGANIYYWIDDQTIGIERPYNAPIVLSLDDMQYTKLHLYAIARVNIGGIDYDSGISNITGYIYDACEEGEALNENGECVMNTNCPQIYDSSLDPTPDNTIYSYKINIKNDFTYTVCSYYNSGQLWVESPYVYSLLSGILKFYYESGQLRSETPYVDDIVNGVSKSYYINGQLEHEKPYVDGHLHGIEKEYYESGGLKKETPRLNGKLNGVVILYYESGQLKKKTPYTENTLNGTIKSYYITGQLEYEKPYVDGHMHGVQKEYYESGQLKEEKPYVDDKLNGVMISYYESGQPSSEYSYINDHLSGTSKIYYESGQLENETPWLNDVANGVSRSYYESGQLENETPWLNGLIHGIEKEYDLSGCLYRELIYENGVHLNDIGYDCTKEEGDH